MDAECLELAQDRDCAGKIVDQDTFGNFQLKSVRLEPGIEQDGMDTGWASRRDGIEIGENIDGNLEWFRPRCRFLAGLARIYSAEGYDETCFARRSG